MNNIEIKIKDQLQKKLPFVLYSKPNLDSIIGFFQHDDTLFEVTDFNEKGFVLARFDGLKTYLIPEDKSEIVCFTLDKKEICNVKKETTLVDQVGKINFKNLVIKAIESIQNNKFKKVVLSRKETVAVPDFDVLETFKKLVNVYPSAFVYCFYHPKIGNWIGATPEQLLKVSGTNFETIALAGTQKDTGLSKILWGEKEKKEQQFVTDYLIESLKNVASEIRFTKPYSIKAGNIWHIKTVVSGVLNSDSSLKKVIGLLHPTPAVCGLPKEIAKKFILENESYNRAFYTGFLGELNCSFTNEILSSDLFVNLRCMQIRDLQADLFMGCGITQESDPENEWEESINKSMTMKKVL